MTIVQTDKSLLDALATAVRKRTTKTEMHKQRVSFILSSLDNDVTITKDKVERELRRLDGLAG